MDPWHEIWRGLRAGESAAYEALLERLGRSVWVYLRRMTGRDEVADELFGRTWLRLVETAGRIESPRAIRRYVLAVARSQWIDELRRRRPETQGLVEDVTVEAAADTSALEALAREEDIARLREGIDALPEALREVAVLRVYAELTFKEIAEVLGMPLGTVLTRMRSATYRLATAMGERRIASCEKVSNDEQVRRDTRSADRGR
ncbi:MAG: sigma-70 family RNA polymerase sigma factor [Phycisphaerae bacterium]|nr:sigma-70 family RNA polymerase sigma factor [Phycisphaerae bacterium]